MSEGQPEFIRCLARVPGPNCHDWRVVGLGPTFHVIEAAWREPIYPGVLSPMAVAQRTLGDGTLCSFTITRNEVRHRVLTGDTKDPMALWTGMRDELEKYCGFAAVRVALELVRLRTVEVPANPAAAARARILAEFGAGPNEEGQASTDAMAYLALQT